MQPKDDRSDSDLFFNVPSLASGNYSGRTQAEKAKERAKLRRSIKARYYASKKQSAASKKHSQHVD